MRFWRRAVSLAVEVEKTSELEICAHGEHNVTRKLMAQSRGTQRVYGSYPQPQTSGRSVEICLDLESLGVNHDAPHAHCRQTSGPAECLVNLLSCRLMHTIQFHLHMTCIRR